MTPKGWVRLPIHEFASRVKEINYEGADLPPFSVTKDRGVMLQAEKYKKRIATDLRKYVVARAGQFAFDPMSLYYGAIGLVQAAPIGVVSPDYVVFETNKTVVPTFLNYLLRSPSMHEEYTNVAEGGNQFGKRRRVYWSVFERLNILLPPAKEQAKIAAILSSLDDAIQTTQAVIDQLGVVKKALMAELLTHGIPGRHAKFKRTEIGEVPEGWVITPLSDVAFVQTGIAKGKPFDNGIEVPYLRVANVQDGYVDLSEVKTIAVDQQAVARYALQPGDVLFTEGGDADKLGRGCVWRGEIGLCLHQNHVFAVRTEARRLLPDYLAHWAASPRGKSYFLDCAKQTTNLASINSTQLRAFPVAIPPVSEQAEIVAAIGSVETRFAVERESHETAISLKTALMSALLTGELRVPPDKDPP